MLNHQNMYLIALGTVVLIIGLYLKLSRSRRVEKALEKIERSNPSAIRPSPKKAVTQSQVYKQQLNEKAASFNRGGLDPDSSVPTDHLVKYFRQINDGLAQKDIKALKKLTSAAIYEKYLKFINGPTFTSYQYSDVVAIVKQSLDNKLIVVYKGKGFSKKEGSFKFERTWHIQKSATGLILMQEN